MFDGRFGAHQQAVVVKPYFGDHSLQLLPYDPTDERVALASGSSRCIGAIDDGLATGDFAFGVSPG